MGNTLLVDYKLLSYGKISSTQNIALDIVAEGKAQDHMIIMADMQSAGRGRYKRPWISQRGNLYASFFEYVHIFIYILIFDKLNYTPIIL